MGRLVGEMWRNEPIDDDPVVAADDEPELAADDESEVELHGSWAGAPVDAAPSA